MYMCVCIYIYYTIRCTKIDKLVSMNKNVQSMQKSYFNFSACKFKNII